MHRWRHGVALALLLGVSGLRALAFASPPDPIWVPGLYDDSDHDDVVLAVLSLDGSRDDAPPTFDPSGRPVARVLPAAPGAGPAAPCPAPGSRAPPAP